MATATHTGPIGIDQINSTFYVWGNGAGFSSVQAAVDYVRVYESGVGEIRIAYGHTGAENIGAVTGGTTSIVIIDLRFGGFQHYLWNGSQFVANAFDQLEGYLTYGQAPTQPASLVIGYDPNGFGTRGAGNIIVTANPGEAMPAFNITCAPQDGVTPPHTYIQCDSDTDRLRVVMRQSLELLTNNAQFNLWMGDSGLNVGAKGLAVYATAATNVVDFQGTTILGPYDQTIRLQHLGGDVEIAPLGTTNLGRTLVTGEIDVEGIIGVDGSFNLTGQMAIAGQLRVGEISCISIQGDDGEGNPQTLQVLGDGHVAGNWQVAGNVSADSAAFNTCLVANSPVRTFANSPDTGGGMEWPPAGIGVSTGTAWGTSIDPVTLQGKLTLTTTGTSGAATLAGNALNIPQYTAPAQVYPGAGLGVSTGSAWGTSIDPATVARTNAANTFTSNQTFNGSVTTNAVVAGAGGNIELNPSGSGNLLLNWSGGSSTGKTIFGNAAGANVGSVDNVGTAAFGQSALRLGNRDVTPAAWASGAANINANAAALVINAPGTGAVFFNWDMGSGGVKFGNGNAQTSTAVATIDSVGNATFNGNGHFGGTFDVSGTTVFHSNVTLANPAELNVLIVDPPGANLLYLNWDSQGTGVMFGNGAGVEAARIVNNGNATFVGTVTAAGKSFRIPHPLDETKDLVHSCLEGPEWGVYYRGETTTANGIAEVTLPDYFEALTFPEDRTVLLTQIYEDAATDFSMLMASRITSGKFSIRSSNPAVKVAWEVKAVRRFGETKLQVVTNKPEPQPLPTLQDEKTEA